MAITERTLGEKPFFIVDLGLRTPPTSSGSKEIMPLDESLTRLMTEAHRAAFRPIDENPSEIVKKRVENALERTLKPYVKESLIIADQVGSREYEDFAEEISRFLNCETGADLCPDGRILGQSIGDARVLSIARVPMGLPKTRLSTSRDNEYVLDDPDKAASIKIKIKKRLARGENPELVQLGAIHVDSENPFHGCGALMRMLSKEPYDFQKEMADGGLRFFFNNFGYLLSAVENNARNAGGKGTFVDTVHDSHFESLIFGLKDALSKPNSYDEGLTLKENLKLLQKKGQIMMTTELDGLFIERIYEEAHFLGVGKLDSKDPKRYAETNMVLGRVAMQITKQEETKGFQWVPDAIRQGKSKAALRTVAYTAIRNTAYRILCDITPGEQKHDEELLMISPINPLNETNKAFPYKVTRGPIPISDVGTTYTLFGMLGGFLKLRKDLETEGKIMLIGGEFSPNIYAHQEDADAEEIRAEMTIRENVAVFRNKYNRKKKAVKNGEAVILGVLIDPDTRRILNFY